MKTEKLAIASQPQPAQVARHSQVHLPTLSQDRRGHHRNLSLDTQFNLGRPMKPVTPIATHIQTRAYEIPSVSSLIRCVFLADTTRKRTRSARMTNGLFFVEFLYALLSLFACFNLPVIHFIVQCPKRSVSVGLPGGHHVRN